MTKNVRFPQGGLAFALIAALLAAVTAGVAVAATVTGPPTAATTINVLSTSSGLGGGGGKVIITGGIGDNGTAYPANTAGKRDPNGSYQELILSKGTILLNKTKLDDALNHAYEKAVLNSATCSTQVAGSGALPIASGTGAYSGVSGIVHISLTADFILPRYKSGKHAGKCNESNAATPTSSLQVVYGKGTVEFNG
jgi:hypothetical protein